MSSICVKAVSKAVREKSIVLNANLEIRQNKISVLLGANGAGKSSLMKTILGLGLGSSGQVIGGQITYGKEDLNKMEIAKKANLIGYLSQNAMPDWNMKVQDLVAIGRTALQKLGQTNKAMDEIAVEAAIDKLNIGHLIGKNIHEISGGELALCLLARVLAGEPKFIFADEPFNHLDIKHQLLLLAALRDFANSGGGVLVIVHDIAMAANLGDEFILMKNGAIISDGALNDVLTEENLMHAYGTRLLLEQIGQTPQKRSQYALFIN